MCSLITLKFGLLQRHIKANSCTKFDASLMDVHRVMDDYLHKEDCVLSHLQGKPIMGIT